MKRWLQYPFVLAGLAAVSAAAMTTTTLAQTPAKQPNILVIWGDDIGGFNISAYNRGMMGYKTPNIDRIANEGALFTDWYGQQSCTAGRAAFITGQSPIRTGLTKVGMPGSKLGLQPEDPTIVLSPNCSNHTDMSAKRRISPLYYISALYFCVASQRGMPLRDAERTASVARAAVEARPPSARTSRRNCSIEPLAKFSERGEFLRSP